MRNVSNLQHSQYFTNTEWLSLPNAIQFGFSELVEEGTPNSLLHPTAAVLRKFGLIWGESEVKLYLGANKYPQLVWVDVLGRSAEVQIMNDRYVWFIEGAADAVDLF